MNETEALKYFEELGALRSKRYRSNFGRDVYAIYFRNCAIENKELRPIRYLKNVIDTVVLDRTLITDLALTYLEGFSLLELLELSKTKITDKGLVSLQGLPALQCIYLDGTDVTEAGIVNLQNFLPACEIVSDFD
jgi:hypothetical protein